MTLSKTLLKTFCASAALSVLAIVFYTTQSSQNQESATLPSDPVVSSPVDSSESTLAATLPDIVDFNDHVQPILSENCYHCHGPDASTRTPKDEPLRLDQEQQAFAKRSDGKPVIIKGDPEASKFIKLIVSEDPHLVMPKPESHKPPLNPEQIALLKKWIKQGAPYEDHWSFIKIERPEVPESTWGYNAVDAYISAKHNEHSLEPNPPASAHRLLRRLSLDITGLPPTPEEITAFKKEAAVDQQAAVKSAVDRLLKTDAYAENFARHWLDTARYADTHGIHFDNYRSIWPYRDWVVESFRKNQPFDQFTIDQIAGDLLPNASLEQKIATGFNRCIPTTGEAGVILKEYEAIYAKDRVDTTSAVWLGLTTGCAACHDHKFDPISQKDFYSMAAYFRNTTMKVMDKNDDEHPPVVFAPTIPDRSEWTRLTQEITTIDQALAKRSKQALSDYRAWLDKQGSAPIKALKNSPEFLLPLTVKNNEITGTINGVTHHWKHQGKTVDSLLGPVANIAEGEINLGKGVAAISADEQISLGGFIRVDGRVSGPIFSTIDPSNHNRGWEIALHNSTLDIRFVDKWPDKTIKLIGLSSIKRKEWIHLMLTYDGKAESQNNIKVYLNGKELFTYYQKFANVDNISSPSFARIGHNKKGDLAFHSLQFYRHILTAEEIEESATRTVINPLLAIPPSQRNEAQQKAIFDYYMQEVDPPALELLAKKSALLAQKNRLRSRGAASLVMEEKKGHAYTHVLKRGDYSTPEKERVYANIPQLFQNKNASSAKQSRKHLAEWIVSKENPLTARVTVNRLWYYFFGRGIVETTEDFGIMGARPTHPKLLDYLAIELEESGWNLQHVIRLITQSASYQQSDTVRPRHHQNDPENLYLSRSPRHRLQAEQIRDLALFASGLLSHKIGGPPTRPYQPEGVWEAVAMKRSDTRFYKQDSGEGLYRRSLYTFRKRTAPHPSMEILNAPSFEVFCVRRDITNTPLQAFVTLNDTQFVESSRVLAQKAIKSASSFDQRLDFITQALQGRALDSKERDIVKDSFERLSQSYQESPELAARLITVGESPADSRLQPIELASWTVIASQIFNLDETLTK